jgi:16S rRNA (cytidine1402-2'-O)-methyltransferase
LVSALTASGLATDEFHFIGFLPHKSGQRLRQLEAMKNIPGTLAIYESPYRIEKLLQELQELFPDRQVVLARELTKKFEEYLRGKPSELLAQIRSRPRKGEFVVLVAEQGEQKTDLPASSTGI